MSRFDPDVEEMRRSARPAMTGPRPRLLSMCTGYGGLDLAVEQVFGVEPVAHCEVEAAPSQILAERWPSVPNLGDITKLTEWPDAEIICAGYPCQPDSLAGKGLSVDDHRWIFPDVARAISAIRPRLVVLENVPGHFVRGFRVVLGTLAELGFDAEWTLVRASDVGAPHKRERLFVVAANTAHFGHERSGPPRLRWTGSADRRQPASDTEGARLEVRRPGEHEPAQPGPVSSEATTPDADDDGLQGVGRLDALGCDADGRGRADVAWGHYEPAIRRWEHVTGRHAPAPTEPNARGGQRLAAPFVEWMMGLSAGWVTDVDISRNEQLKALGNGVVPQQAAEALRRMLTISKGKAA